MLGEKREQYFLGKKRGAVIGVKQFGGVLGREKYHIKNNEYCEKKKLLEIRT